MAGPRRRATESEGGTPSGDSPAGGDRPVPRGSEPRPRSRLRAGRATGRRRHQTPPFLDAFVARTVAESPAAGRARAGRQRLYPGVTDAEWYDWRWQLRHRVTSLDDLMTRRPFPREEWTARRAALHGFRMAITPYHLTLIDPDDHSDPVARQVCPLVEEHEGRASGHEDPLGEESASPVPGITHRYPDRALMVVTNSCATYCRFCTRKRIMYEGAVPELSLDAMVDYVARTPSIRDVIVSGGDPLTLATSRLERILSRLRAIPHVEVLRIGTRVPVSLPMRVTDELCRMLERHHPLFVNVHFNHANEITPDAARACDRLLRAGIPLNSQTVLLRGVNDDVSAMRELVQGLLAIRVRPYYLFLCDDVRGSAHFRTTVGKGIEIVEGLRGHTSGLAVPRFAVDTPGAGGKVPVAPYGLLSYRDGRAELRTFRGDVVEVLDPVRPDDSAPGAVPATAAGFDLTLAGTSAWVRAKGGGEGSRGE